MDIFNSLSKDAKVWVYAANRILTNNEVESIQLQLNSFSSNWTAHQMPLQAKAAVLYHTFLVFMVDESVNAVSGCGIDKSVALVKEIGNQYNIDFFNRLNLQALVNNEVEIIGSSKIKEALASGRLTPETTVFNNLVQTKQAFVNEWQIALSNSWAVKFLNQTT